MSNLHGYSIQEHMALLAVAEGGPRSLLVYKHGPPDEGQPLRATESMNMASMRRASGRSMRFGPFTRSVTWVVFRLHRGFLYRVDPV
jgi:hypothetical protein